MTTAKSTKLASRGVAWSRALALAFTLVLAALAFSAVPGARGGEPTRKLGGIRLVHEPERHRDRRIDGGRVRRRHRHRTRSTSSTRTAPRSTSPALGSNALTGIATPAGSFSFPSAYGTPAAIAVDNSTSPSDPSAGDLYVMDAGHGVIDKFSPDGEYLSQITGFAPATGSSERELLGLAVDASGTVRVDLGPGSRSANWRSTSSTTRPRITSSPARCWNSEPGSGQHWECPTRFKKLTALPSPHGR